MNLNSIAELNEEDIMLLFKDIAEFGDTSIAGCCCAGYGGSNWDLGKVYTKARCQEWCRARGHSNCMSFSNRDSGGCQNLC